MAEFGKTSRERLETCHPKIIKLFEKVVEKYDCSVLEGVRSIERQRSLVDSGRSTTMHSKHLPNKNGLSLAADVVPYPISWGATEQKAILNAINSRSKSELLKLMMDYRLVYARFYHFAGYVRGVAEELDIDITWGGDWNGNFDFKDQTFHDLPHFQIKL